MNRVLNVCDHFGFYIGKDSALVISPEFTAVFLRLNDNHIITALMKDGRITGLVSGHRDGKEHLVYSMLHAAESRIVRPVESLNELNEIEHALETCSVTFTADGAVCSLGTQQFPLALGARIDLDEIRRPLPFDAGLSIAERMQAWNKNCWFIVGQDGQSVHANIGDGHFDCHWEINVHQNIIYCHLGVNGYCEKGWAMKPTVQLRAFACGMLPDHREALFPYHPIEECFVADSCAFPDDGGWYWSVKEVSDDMITLNSCGGDTYTINRPR